MANAAAARRADFAPVGAVPHGYAEIANAAACPVSLEAPVVIPHRAADLAEPTPSSAPAAGGAQPVTPPSAETTNVNTALHLLFGYIPTEALTLYVAVLAALHESAPISNAQRAVFWAFLVATPLVVWLVYAAKVKAARKTLPLHPSQWPVWEMLAATVAYFAWAFAMPNNPFAAYTWYSSGLAGIAVLLASTLLGLLAPLFQRPINP